MTQDRLFHGTKQDIVDTVRPGNSVGVKPSNRSLADPGSISGGDHAFAVKNDEKYAWQAATDFHVGKGRARVYEVDPAKGMSPGPHHPKQDEWASRSGFKVKDRIDIMPGRQGTFSQLNWNQFGDEGYGHVPDLNHPTDAQVGSNLADQARERHDHFHGLNVKNSADAATKAGRALPVVQPHGQREQTLPLF